MTVLGSGIGATEAQAQSANASAEILFSEGRRLMGDGKIAEACPKFADSQKLDPSSGTLLNLANCYEKLGRTASAWATYQEAASLASSTGRTDNLEVAQKRAAALKPLLATVVVAVPSPVDGIEVKRDGVSVVKAEWGLGVPIDPGSHIYIASAPGYKDARVTLEVPKATEGQAPPALDVKIPALEKEPPKPIAPLDKPGPEVPTTPAPVPDSWRPQRTAALVVGGVGLVGLGVGIGFAVSAKSKYDSSLSLCPKDPNKCTPAGVEQRNSARTQGNVATGAIIGGGVLAAAGIVLWFTAPASSSAPPAQKARAAQRSVALRESMGIGVSPDGVVLGGAW